MFPNVIPALYDMNLPSVVMLIIILLSVSLPLFLTGIQSTESLFVLILLWCIALHSVTTVRKLPITRRIVNLLSKIKEK